MARSARSKTAGSCMSWNCWCAAGRQSVELEGDLLGLDRRVEIARFLCLAQLPGQEGEELARVVDHDLAYCTGWAAVELGLDRVEETAAGEHLGAVVGEPVA